MKSFILPSGGNLNSSQILVLLFIFTVCCSKNENNISNDDTMPELWSAILPVEIYYSSPVLSNDEKTICIGTSVWLTGNHRQGQVFVAFDAATGKEKWRLQLGANEVRSTPAIASDNSLYFAVELRSPADYKVLGDELWHLSADGILLWKYNINPRKLTMEVGLSSPAIGSDGTIYVAGDRLYAISQDGLPLWTFDLASAGFTGILRSSPAVDGEGSIYFGINTGNPSSAFFALNSDGTLKWKFEPSDLPSNVPSTHFDIYSSPALGSDGAVYFGQEFGRVYSLNAADGSLIGMATTKSAITWSSPAIDSKGVLYIADLSGRIYAFQTGSKGLSQSAAWPKFRSDNQNRGRKK